MQLFLIVNPRSGTDSPSADELRDAARERGITVHVLEDGDDLAEVARGRRARTCSAWRAATARSPRSLTVAIEQDLPFVCIPFGTRNHFARDLGLDRDDPLGRARRVRRGDERRVDVGRVGDRLFLNNVSLGLYARLVHRREHHRRRRTRSRGCARSR